MESTSRKYQVILYIGLAILAIAGMVLFRNILSIYALIGDTELDTKKTVSNAAAVTYGSLAATVVGAMLTIYGRVMSKRSKSNDGE